MRRAVQGLLLVLCGAPAAAQGLTHFFCYVPNSATGTVYMSQILPVGPVGERSSYGAQFVAHLRAKGLISGPAQGYCTMRPSAAAAEAGRINVSEGPCPECGGASKVKEVEWPFGAGTDFQPRPVAVTKPPAGASKQPPPPPDPARTKVEMPIGVIMGNVRDGSMFFASLGEDPLADARREAKKRGGEWRVIYSARDEGMKVAFACVVEGEGDKQTIHFFAGDDFDYRISRVLARANAARKADEIGRSIVDCGKPFVVPGRADPKPTSLIDDIKGMVRAQVSKEPCDPSVSPKVSARLLDEEAANPDKPQLLHELLETPGPGGGKRCIIFDRPKDRQNGSPGPAGARG